MIMKLLLMPVYILLLIIRMVTGVAIRLADWIFYIIGGFLLIVTLLSYCFGLESGDSIKTMVIGSGVFLLIPQAAEVIEGILEFCVMAIGDRIGGH